MNQKKVLIFGGGIAGRLVIDEIRSSTTTEYLIIGIVDDKKKVGTKINGVTILGNQSDIPDIVKRYQVQEVIVAIPSASGDTIRKFVKTCESLKVGFRIVPKLISILQKSQVNLEQIRSIEPADLLGRDLITSDLKDLEKVFTDRSVLITGAAGSIGSELCRQISNFRPSRVILLDWNENGMFDLEHELRSSYPAISFIPVIGNVQDETKLLHVFKKYRPYYVFHAAAFKHVPLMEENPEEAIKNNIIGTLNVCRVAQKTKVKKFVFISTDKAVNPTNVMGASKRVAEMGIQWLPNQGGTKFMGVRFGNVLASNGSVIPYFMKQIANGGPVTVTDPRIIRYFMTIPEAVQLVLQSSFIGQGGEIFVLDMGEPVKIIDLARNLIRLSGLIPGQDIKIKYIGLRPGEKLYEETLTDKEHLECVKKDKIYIAPNQRPTKNPFPKILKLQKAAEISDRKLILRLLREVVPNFMHRRDNDPA